MAQQTNRNRKIGNQKCSNTDETATKKKNRRYKTGSTKEITMQKESGMVFDQYNKNIKKEMKKKNIFTLKRDGEIAYLLELNRRIRKIKGKKIEKLTSKQ